MLVDGFGRGVVELAQAVGMQRLVGRVERLRSVHQVGLLLRVRCCCRWVDRPLLLMKGAADAGPAAKMRNYFGTSPAIWRNRLRNHDLDSVALFRAGFLSSVTCTVRIVWRMISDRCERNNERRPLHLSSGLSLDLGPG